MSKETPLAAASRHAGLAARGQQALIEAMLARAARRAGLVAFAVVAAIFGLAGLDGAAFAALRPFWGAALAFVAVALGNFALAALCLALAARKTRPAEIAEAEAMRDAALQALELDVRIAAEEWRQTLRRPFALFSGPLAALMAALLAAFLRSRGKGGAK